MCESNEMLSGLEEGVCVWVVADVVKSWEGMSTIWASMMGGIE